MPETVIAWIAYWVSERLRDASQWPVTLIRDLPARLFRLGQTLWRGVRGIITFLPEGWQAHRENNLSPWLRFKTGRLADWWHQFLVQLFDLGGGPELSQFIWRLGVKTTPLTGAEISAITAVLGPHALRFGEVRIAQGGLLTLIFKLNGNLAFATWHTINIPQNGRHTRTNLPVLIHELTHVYQYERVGSRYLGEAIYMLIKTKRDCYNYGGTDGLRAACGAGLRYCDFNREQQAKITQDYFTLQQKGSDVTAYEPLIAQARQGIL